MCHEIKGGDCVKSYPPCMLCFIRCSCIIINGLFKLLSIQYRNILHAVVNFLMSLNSWII